MIQTYIDIVTAFILTWIAAVMVIITGVCVAIVFSNPRKEGRNDR